MKHLPALAAALCLSLGAAAAHADCYTVLNAKGKIISQSPNPPVDMSKPLHETVPAKFGAGATMVFGIADGNCGKELENTWGSAARDAAIKGSGKKAVKRKATRKRRATRKAAAPDAAAAAPAADTAAAAPAAPRKARRRGHGDAPIDVTPAKGGGIREQVQPMHAAP